jgi:hypothetical protein
MANKFMVSLACLVFSASMLFAGDKYDGVWWLAADENARQIFVEGYLACRAFYCSPSQRQPERHPLKMRKAVELYYAGGGERLLEPVWQVIERLIPDPAVAFDPVPPDVVGEPCCGGDCRDGIYWQGLVGPGTDAVVFRSVFIAGLLECLKHFGPKGLKFSKAPEYYVAKLNEFYGVTPEDPDAVSNDDAVACKPIFEVLKELADKP